MSVGATSIAVRSFLQFYVRVFRYLCVVFILEQDHFTSLRTEHIPISSVIWSSLALMLSCYAYSRKPLMFCSMVGSAS